MVIDINEGGRKYGAQSLIILEGFNENSKRCAYAMVMGEMK